MAGTVLDASALIAGLTGEPARREVEEILRDRPPAAISAVNLAEVVDRLIRMGGWSEVTVRHRVTWLIAGGLVVEPVWIPISRLAGALRAEHYQRSDFPLSLSDCVCLATALHIRGRLATCDAALATLSRSVGIDVVALPNSAGQRPS